MKKLCIDDIQVMQSDVLSVLEKKYKNEIIKKLRNGSNTRDLEIEHCYILREINYRNKINNINF